jgi:hypothetical protein
MQAVRLLPKAAKLNVTGLVLTAAGMLVQIGAGSELYPSLAGPIVLLATAAVVAARSDRWTPWLGLLVPLVLGLGAIVAAIMSGEFIEQLTDVSQVGLLVGSLMHVTGLVVAVAGGFGMLSGRRGQIRA